MARISVKITPLHPDGTECTHAVSPSGKPRDPAAGYTWPPQLRRGVELLRHGRRAARPARPRRTGAERAPRQPQGRARHGRYSTPRSARSGTPAAMRLSIIDMPR